MMFHYLKGTVTHVEAGLAVVDCGGVGYACNTTATTIGRLQNGQAALLYTYCYIREDAFDIYGFYSQDELRLFKMLIGVSGVGPKAAISILSAGSPEHFALAIITGDDKALTAAQGVGKKIAQRIILELKDKMAKQQSDFGAVSDFTAPVSAGKTGEAAAALAVLGYSQREIAAAIKGVDVDNLGLEEIIRQSLRKMVK